MEISKVEQLQEHAREIAKILYSEAEPEEIRTLEGIEKTVRKQLLEYINPEIAKILSLQLVEQQQAEKEV